MLSTDSVLVIRRRRSCSNKEFFAVAGACEASDECSSATGEGPSTEALLVVPAEAERSRSGDGGVGAGSLR